MGEGPSRGQLSFVRSLAWIRAATLVERARSRVAGCGRRGEGDGYDAKRFSPVFPEAHPRRSMLEQPTGLCWRAHFRARVGLGQVGPERHRPGVGPGRDVAGWSGTPTGMSDVTHILSAIEQGDPQAAEQLLPLVYDGLRKLAAQKLAQEKPGQTLQATALVHEAYLRLVGDPSTQTWENARHFFAAAAEAMRRILIERARRKRADKHGSGRRRACRRVSVVLAR